MLLFRALATITYFSDTLFATASYNPCIASRSIDTLTGATQA